MARKHSTRLNYNRENLERAGGLEPLIRSLEGSHSAIELRPRSAASTTPLCDSSAAGVLNFCTEPVSRVLSALRRDDHSSRPAVAGWLKLSTRRLVTPRAGAH